LIYWYDGWWLHFHYWYWFTAIADGWHCHYYADIIVDIIDIDYAIIITFSLPCHIWLLTLFITPLPLLFSWFISHFLLLIFSFAMHWSLHLHVLTDITLPSFSWWHYYCHCQPLYAFITHWLDISLMILLLLILHYWYFIIHFHYAILILLILLITLFSPLLIDYGWRYYSSQLFAIIDSCSFCINIDYDIAIMPLHIDIDIIAILHCQPLLILHPLID